MQLGSLEQTGDSDIIDLESDNENEMNDSKDEVGNNAPFNSEAIEVGPTLVVMAFQIAGTSLYICSAP